MTIKDLECMDCAMLTPAQAASVIGCDPQLIRVMAREKPGKLGFPVTLVGSRVKIPRLPFLQYITAK